MVTNSNIGYNDKVIIRDGLRKISTSETGVSLIQVLMASTAIAGLALVGLRLAKDQKELAARTYQTYLIEYFTQEVTYLLYKKKTCKLTLGGLSPEKASFSVLRESLGENEDLVRLHFPSRENEGSDGALFNDEFTLISYQLNGSHPEANLSKNITMLEIFLAQKGKEGTVRKAIPLSFKKNASGNIESCSASTLAGEGIAEGFWKRQGPGLGLPNLAATVGKISNRNAGLAIEGNLRLMASENEKPCTNKIEGVMTYTSEGKLVYCHEESWKPVGFNVFSWASPKRYNLTQTKLGIAEKELGPYRYCYLTRKSFNSADDRCELSRKFERQPSTYLFKAISSRNVTNINCEVTCVD